MFDRIIKLSLKFRYVVFAIATLIVIFGVLSLLTMKVDVLPDINKPTVSIFTEGEGLAPEEIERLILNQVEAAVAGAPGVERVRGTASFGLAIVNAEFSWGTDIYRNRQIIQERLANLELPEGARPVLGPVSSVMGEIMWVGLTTNNPDIDPMELRTLADWTIRPTLLRVTGVSDVIIMGGDVREWQINLNAERMKQYGLRMRDIEAALEGVLGNKSGGILVQGGQEYPIRVMITPAQVSELQEIAVETPNNGKIVLLGDIAQIVEGPSPIRGRASIDGMPGVIMRVAKQPEAETLKVTEAVDESLKSLKASLPQDTDLKNDLFRQEWFIDAGLGNVIEALRDGTILVIIILILFLMNLRVTVITLTAIPLSILVTAIIFKMLGFSVNVMTLGGIAVAIGELVDDAIVDVENVHHRLREWRRDGMRENILQVVYKASSEVRNSIVYATVLVAIVFLPIFFLPGVEGRLLSSLGAAYLISLIASLFVSLTVTPAMASVLLAKGNVKEGHDEETRLVKFIKSHISRPILWGIHHSTIIFAVTILAVAGSIALYLMAGREGIPPFNEGSATINAVMPVGTDLDTSNQFASRVEQELKKIKSVQRVSHLTGRAGADPHDSGANTSEIQVTLKQGLEGESEQIFEEIQTVLDRFSGADFSLGQPITHRVEELLSGVRAPIVVKVFGDDLQSLRDTAEQVRTELAKNSDIKNPQVQREVMVPEFRIYLNRNQLAQSGIPAGEVSEELEQGLLGIRVGQVQIGASRVDVMARYDTASRGNSYALRDLPLPFDGVESLSAGASDLRLEAGRNKFSHEGGKRTLTVTANYQGSDIVGAVEGVKSVLDSKRLPTGMSLSYEGTYKSQKESSSRLIILFGFGIVFIFAILFKAFGSVPLVLQIMLNIPTVIIGGVIAVWLSGGIINLAHMVGFISLAGIVSRNGIMLVGRALQLVRGEGLPFTPETILQATLDRVVPVLMTALVTALALIPLMLAGGEPGKEMLSPLANVIFGGLMSSTIISLFLTPALFYRFGKKAAMQQGTKATGF
ncbi:MAG: efflux RND transporter permease subunit [bacterium]|nr:efflux RND transporter permease subunit [bacterium]